MEVDSATATGLDVIQSVSALKCRAQLFVVRPVFKLLMCSQSRTTTSASVQSHLCIGALVHLSVEMPRMTA